MRTIILLVCFTLMFLSVLIACNTKAPIRGQLNAKSDTVVEWKNGIVYLKNAPTRRVFNTLEKWYHVRVTYSIKKVPECLFTGKITPETEIQTVLEIMQFQCDDLHVKFDSAKKELIVLHSRSSAGTYHQ